MEGIPPFANAVGEIKDQIILAGEKETTILKIIKTLTEKYGISEMFDKLPPKQAIKKMQDLILRGGAYPDRSNK